MNNIREKEIKKEDKKAFKGFAIVLVVCFISGGILGGMSGYFKEILGDSVPSLLINTLKVITPFASLVFSILIIIAYKIIYTNSKKEYGLWTYSYNNGHDYMVSSNSFLCM